MSQAMALTEYLEDAGHTIERVFTGCRTPDSMPGYFLKFFHKKLDLFFSPYFMRTPNKKGIYVGKTLLMNLLRSLIYLREVKRIRNEIGALKPDVVFNFYDVVGALAMKKLTPAIRRIGIGHHFFLHLDGYKCKGGSGWHKWLLKIHTRVIVKACDRVLALSFREEQGDSIISVAPPLIRKTFRDIKYTPGDRFLVYLLNEGYLFDLIRISRDDPDFSADVFTALSPEIDLPPGIRLYPLDDDTFRKMMTTCKGLITTAGFDTVAEAGYQGIPLVVIPSQHHFEQRCNSVDVERSGIGIAVDQLLPGIQHHLTAGDNQKFRQWVNLAREMIIISMQE
jgi:uncharacterized protein (TIGR00661 family)